MLLQEDDPEIQEIFENLQVVKNKRPEYETHRSYVISTTKVRLLEGVKDLNQVQMANSLVVTLFNE